MNILLKVLPHDLPVFIRRGLLGELWAATADGFGCPRVALESLPYDGCLQAYALFTREQAEKTLQAGDGPAIKLRLYRNAFPLGRKLRRWFGVETFEDVMRIGKILYRAIGVDIEGYVCDGDRSCMTVSRCYFCRFYTGPVCSLISALDDGVFSGLSGGARLVFSERLTQGSGCCRATLQVRSAG